MIVALGESFSSCSPPVVDEIFTWRFSLSTFFSTPDSSVLELAEAPSWPDELWLVDVWLDEGLALVEDWLELDGFVLGVDAELEGLVLGVDAELEGLVLDVDAELEGLVLVDAELEGLVLDVEAELCEEDLSVEELC